MQLLLEEKRGYDVEQEVREVVEDDQSDEGGGHHEWRDGNVSNHFRCT